MKSDLKVILVGNSGVGKSSLLTAFYSQPFDCQTVPTVAPSYSCIEINRKDGVKVWLQVWDTAGQERYQSVGKLFYRDCDVAFVCFDGSKDHTLDSVKNWINTVREESPDANILVILTKSDLYSSELIETETNSINSIMEEYRIKGFFVTSSVLQRGVKDAFQSAANFYQASKSIKTGSQPIPQTQSNCC